MCTVPEPGKRQNGKRDANKNIAMCGIKPCRACAKVAGRKKSMMARRKMISQKGVLATAKAGAETYLGYVAGKALVNNIPQLQTNPLIGIVTQVGIAAFMGGARSGIQNNIARGMAVSAMQTAINTLLPDIASKIGIAGPYGSYMTPGVSGRVGQSQPTIRVQ